MATHRQKPEFVFLSKFTEADGTIKWLLGANYLRVEKDWQRINVSLVETRVMEVEELPKLTLECFGSSNFCGVWLPARVLEGAGERVLLDDESQQEVEKTGNEKYKSNNDYDEEEYWAYPAAR